MSEMGYIAVEGVPIHVTYLGFTVFIILVAAYLSHNTCPHILSFFKV